jgi:2,4-dienoyl-CoA reductase-like NADH-dependent reductase (Old Yellow Enzyme family)
MHERFRYKNKDELIAKVKDLGYDLPFSDDVSPLFDPIIMDGIKIPNRLVVQPMEGYDSEDNGSPSSLTERRYLRYATGGSGVIWFEAVAVSSEGRSNPHQLLITGQNAGSFSSVTGKIIKEAQKRGHDPLLVMQLTHSGRYSRPHGKPAPMVPALNPLLDKGDPYIVTDDDLKRIQDQFIAAAKLVSRAGINAIDLKACHGYLMIELLSAKGRKNSIYGGEEPEKRFRFLLETVERIKDELPRMVITMRLSIWDGYKGGFGVGKNDIEDFTEPLRLIRELKDRGVKLINITMGSPYFNPHITRPYDNPVPGTALPEEHPLQGVMRMMNGTAFIQRKFPDILLVGSAYSYLRQFAPNVGAAVVKNGCASFIGFGRNSFAYPEMPDDLKRTGMADPKKICITCSGCTRLIRNLRHGGCVIRDREIYGRELKKLIADGH